MEDDAEDGDFEGDDVEVDGVKEEEDVMLMLRRMMLRRKTNPTTGGHTLCEPAQSTRM